MNRRLTQLLVLSTLYVASHVGVFRVEDGEKVLAAERQQDTVGFVVVGAGHFLGSGHPDPDAGESWEPLSLLGEADLHSIEMVDDGSVLVSPDGATEWRAVGAVDGPVEALEVAPLEDGG